MKKVDLNCDMAEVMPGRHKNFDAEIMPFISSCNVACGFHSGNPVIISKTIRSAIRYNVKIGAHPSYNDPENFGRKSMLVDLDILIPELRYQICAIKGIVESLGSELHHVKPHGALYNDMAQNASLADAFVTLVKTINPKLRIYGLSGSILSKICADHGMNFIREGFADRRYETKNKLRSRNLEESVLTDTGEVKKQINLFSQGKVMLHSGVIKNLEIDSLCLHSDTEGAVQLSKVINSFLLEKEISLGI